MNWRPIETAPKDGAYYLFLHKNGGMHTACWNSVFEDWRITQSSISRQFTHWMPLPPPPSTEPAPQSVGDGREPWGHDLWKHLHDEHSLMLLESELQQIVRKSVPLVGDLSQVVVVDKKVVERMQSYIDDVNAAYSECRDSVLNERYGLAEEDSTSEQINATLGILDSTVGVAVEAAPKLNAGGADE